MTVRRNMPGAQEQKNDSTVACDTVRIVGTSERADIDTWNAKAATASTETMKRLCSQICVEM